MRSENGIPRPFQPNNQAQELRDLKRKVAELEARRTFVSLERIVEGGTIDANVGKQITDTVQKDIVIDGGNLGEGALDGQRMVGAIIETNATANRGVKIDDTGLRGYDADGNRYMKADETGLEMTGSISTKGKTAEEVPRDISVQLTTVTRKAVGAGDVSNPSLVFVTTGTPQAVAPGIYSPDGKSLTLMANTADGSGLSQFTVGQGAIGLAAEQLTLGAFLGGGSVKIGNTGFLGGTPADVNLLGNVKVNGKAIGDTDPAPLLLTSLTGADQPAKADDDVAISWTGASGDTSLWGYNYSPRYPTRLYAQKAGVYFLTGNVAFSPVGGGMRGVWFRKNGTKRIRGQSNPPPSAWQLAEIDAHNYEVMAPGDYIEVMATVAGAVGAVSVKANEGTTGGLEWKRPA